MGARHPSVAETLSNTVGAGLYQHMLCGVNASRQIQLFRNDGGANYEIIGYTGTEFVPLTTVLLLTVTAALTWETVSVASVTGSDTATGVALWMGGSQVNGLGGARHPDSTDNFLAGNSGPSFIGPAATWFCGLNGSEQLQIQLLNTSRSMPVIGYFRSGFTWNTNAANRGPASSGSYVDLTAFASGNTAGMYLYRGEDNAMVRRNGDTFNALGVYDYQEWIVEGDGSRIVEAQVANTATDIFELGALATSVLVAPPTISSGTGGAPDAQANILGLTNAGNGPSDRVFSLRYGAVSIAQPETSGSNTQGVVTVTYERDAPLTSMRRGVTAQMRVTRNSDNEFAEVAFTTASPSDEVHVDLTSINTTAADRASSAADLAIGDQLQWRGPGGGPLPAGFVAYPDGAFGFTGGNQGSVVEFRVFDAADSTLGAWTAMYPAGQVVPDPTTGPFGRVRSRIRVPTSRF
jgi:hypothetical protein